MCMYVKTKMETTKTKKKMLNKYIFILMFNKQTK